MTETQLDARLLTILPELVILFLALECLSKERLTLTHLWNMISEERLQFALYFILTILVSILTVGAHSANHSVFQRFFGSLSPRLIVGIVILIGLLLFAFLLSTSQFAIYNRAKLNGPVLAIGLALPFAAVMILIDRLGPFPKNINIAFPISLSFYPVMAFVVEILFHLLPIGLLFFLFLRINETANLDRVVWIIFLIVALIEPVFQVVLGKDQNASFVVAFMGLFLFVFNYVQLFLFRRYDFISMYSFRISYYVLWHIVWGHIRLKLLF